MTEVDVEALEVRLLVDAIRARYDYDLGHYAPGFLRRRLSAALGRAGIGHLGELQHRVLIEPTMFFSLLEDLSVPVTEMFRDPKVFAAFRSVVVPLLRTYPMLKIWHAGCATGEEVYSTAILLSEAGLYDRCQIYATDLSSAALALAKEGVYDASQVDAYAANYSEAGGTERLSDYFTEAYGRIAMRDSLRRNILFFQHNLVADYVFGEMHVIFCRNVLIYYDRPMKRRVLETFSKSLRPGGVLCLGSSERLTSSDGALGFRELVEDARIYRHEPTGDGRGDRR